MSFDAARAIFNQVDANRDGTIDQSEFARWATGGFGAGGGFGSSSSNSAGGSWSEAIGGGAAGGGGFISGGESSQWASGGVGASGASSLAADMARCNVQRYATNAQGHYIDPNPRTETRVTPGGAQTYTQNIRIRFLQPPPLPGLQPNIIRERRGPQPPAPPPFHIRDTPKPVIQPPPLIIRERPPQAPPIPPPTNQVVELPPFPAPPRSVITERSAPLPPRPRDVIMERWVPYGQFPPRRTVRVPAPCGPLAPPPRNVVIQYTPIPARIVRQFQRGGVTVTEPQSYIQQYGASLLDSATFVQQARSAGVVEDITPPAGNYGAAWQNSAAGAVVAGGEAGASYAAEGGFGGVVSGGSFGESLSGGASYSESALGGASYGGLVSGGSFGESVSGGAAYGGAVSGSSFESSSSSELIGGGAGFSVAGGDFASFVQ